MYRRHFVKLSAATAAALLFTRVTHAAINGTVLNNPDAVYIETDESNGWVKLQPDGGSAYRYRDITVTLKIDGGSTGVYLLSPAAAITGIRLAWNHQAMEPASLVLGDSFERTYGDKAWKKPLASIKNPWYVLIHDGRDTACFGVKTGCSAICWWNIEPGSLELVLDTHSGGAGVQLGSRELHAADVISAKSSAAESAFGTAQHFCRLMCSKPRLPKQPVYGINDWYYAYGNNSPKLIKEQTALMAGLVTDTSNRPFSVIDAGWAAYSPLLPGDCCWQEDFSRPNEKFKDMHRMAGDIKALGMRPGLWMRPLCAKHDDNNNLLSPKIPGRDDPKNPVLDPTIPENIERIKDNMAIYRQWGFELVKHDFTTYDITGRWGFNMKESITLPGWHFNDRSKTTAEIINHLYRSIRESAGDMYVIGCNTLSHLSAGLFELNRIGDDTSGREWDRTRKMGVNTLGFRMPQHNTFYAADGDCVGLTNQVPWVKNKQWMQLLAESSAPLFISAQPDALGTEQRSFIRECFAKSAKVQPVGQPLDWLANPLPARWRLNGREVDFDWG